MRDLLFLDGAMGTMLQTLGLKPGECPELLNVSRPDWIKEIHRSYANAGADIVETNTFGGNRIKLGNYGLSERAYELNYAGVRLAKEATEGMGVLVAASMGPTGRLMEPLGDVDFHTCYEAFKEQVRAFRDAGADIISIETMSSLDEAGCALMAARDTTDLPVICHLSFDRGGRTLMGDDPATAVAVSRTLGAFAVGANCSVGPSDMVGVIHAMSRVSSIPISAEPNAGLPELVNGVAVYPETPETMAEHAEELVRAGASIVGGCCGTTPEHIRAIRRRLGKLREPATANEVFQRMRSNWKFRL
ncbi:MAG: homocysteine S-methyltransferase family protein [Bacillota bacterium]